MIIISRNADVRDAIAHTAMRYHISFMKNTHLCVFLAVCALAIASPAAADQNDPRLGPLFEKLKSAPDFESGHEIEQYIWLIWGKTQTAGGSVLYRQGEEYMEQGEYEKALESFDALVVIEPEFAEGWNKRATVHYLMGKLDASIADIKRTLALEERHFGALSGLGLIYDALDQKEAALKAFRAALEIHPNMQAIRRRAEELIEETEGIPL